jgi:PAS domain S-box-containing protein
MLVRRISLSTGQTLSVLTSAVVIAVLAIGVSITWAFLRGSAVEAAQDRMTRGVRQLATNAVNGLRQQQLPRYAAVTSDPAIRRALRSRSTASDIAAARVALSKLRTDPDSGLPIELWRLEDRRRVAFIGNDIRPPAALDVGGEGAPLLRGLRPGLDSISLRDSLQLGQLYSVGNRTFLWIAAPVIDSGRTIGFVIRQARIARNPQTDLTVRELIGDSVSGYYRNNDGTAWTTFGGVPTRPTNRSTTDTSIHSRPDIGKVIFAEQRITGTPLVMAMEVPERVVLAGARRTVRGLGALSVALAIAGAGLAWIVGGRVARPITSLTEASEAVARGDYEPRVFDTGSREVSRLGAAFNRMAGQIGESRVELERREAALRALADAIPQLAWMADGHGRVFWFNQRWYEYTGASAADPQHSQWVSAHDPAFFAAVESRWTESVRAGRPFEMEVKLRDAKGVGRWFLTRVAPMSDGNGGVTRWFGTSTDVQALREARDAAVAASRAKSEFLTAMSHELRTPLNAIGGYAELMEMGIRGPITQEQRRDLSRIRTSQEHLLGLIASLLDLTRIENGSVRYAMANVAIAPVFADLEALISPQAAAKQQVVTFEIPEPQLIARADREKLRQILLNLLSNAVRHTPPGTSIAVAARRVEDSSVEIVVRDTGPGVAADQQESIFEPFVQLDRTLTNLSQQGVGLGLAISRDLARGMGGELTIASAPGAGAAFSLRLPAGVLDASTMFMVTMETPIGGPLG